MRMVIVSSRLLSVRQPSGSVAQLRSPAILILRLPRQVDAIGGRNPRERSDALDVSVRAGARSASP